MFLKHLDLTTALRPSYLPDEVLLFVQDNVGLYEGSTKLPNYQNGQVYLTSHRICYVDLKEPRQYSVALYLKDVERHEISARLFRSSPKITLVPKALKGPPSALPVRSLSATPGTQPANDVAGSPAMQDVVATNWVCPICTFSNPMPSNFDPHTASSHTPLPPCLTCGIKPTLAHLLKAAITSSRQQSDASRGENSAPSPFAPSPFAPQPFAPSRSRPWDETIGPEGTPAARPESNECPSCTFHNYPSLLVCEMCSTPLRSKQARVPQAASRMASPAPGTVALKTTESIKLSFRGGGERAFYERLKGSIIQRKWLLQGAPPAPKNSMSGEGFSAVAGRDTKTAGIAGLEQLGLSVRRGDEDLMGNAFADLQALMASAKEVVELAERLARQTAAANGGASTDTSKTSAILVQSASQLGLVTTKDLVGTGSSSETLYASELSRNLAEFLTDDARGVLKKAGGIITLVDLWAMFNRARGGVELVSPTDFEKAARMWETLKLPLRLRQFKKSGVLVVQGRDRTDETTIKAILGWLDDLHEFPPDDDVPWDWHHFGRGVTAREAAERFGWSVGVAEEELEMAEEKGALCREESIEGLMFWKNHIVDTAFSSSDDYGKWLKELEAAKADKILKASFRQQGLL